MILKLPHLLLILLPLLTTTHSTPYWTCQRECQAIDEAPSILTSKNPNIPHPATLLAPQTWVSTPTPYKPRHLYLFGGQNYGIPFRDYNDNALWRYNINRKQWKLLGGGGGVDGAREEVRGSVGVFDRKNWPQGRTGGFVFDFGEKLKYVGFGYGDGQLGDFWGFDERRGLWAFLGDYEGGDKGKGPRGRNSGTGWVVRERGLGFVFGGQSEEGEMSGVGRLMWKGVFQVGKAVLPKWEVVGEKGRNPRARFDAVGWSTFADVDGLYLAGGRVVGGVDNELWRFDVVSEKWEVVEVMDGVKPVFGDGNVGASWTDPESGDLMLTLEDPGTRIWRFSLVGKKWFVVQEYPARNVKYDDPQRAGARLIPGIWTYRPDGVFLFGGASYIGNGSSLVRLNDMWRWNLEKPAPSVSSTLPQEQTAQGNVGETSQTESQEEQNFNQPGISCKISNAKCGDPLCDKFFWNESLCGRCGSVSQVQDGLPCKCIIVNC